MADNLTPLPVKTKTDGDVAIDLAQYLGSAGGASNAIHVQPGTGASFAVTNAGTFPVQVDGAALTALQIIDNPVKVDDAAFTPATDSVSMVGATFDDAAPDSVDEGDAGALRMSANRNLYITIRDAAGNERGANVDASGNLNAILAANSGVDIGDVDILSGPTGTSALEVQGTAADGAAAVGDPVQIGGVDGSSNMQSIAVDTSGHLQVDVLTGGGSDTPTTPLTEDVTSASLAAGASVDLDSTDVGAATKKLSGVDIWASVPWKARIMTVANAVETIHTVLGGPPMVAFAWRPPHRDYVTQGPAGAGFDGFRVEMTNLDNADAADVYATFYTEE